MSLNRQHCAQLKALVIMAALRSRCGHYILPCGFFYLLSSFFPRLISVFGDRIFTILPHMVGLSANLECMSETCCTRLAEKNRTQKWCQKSPSGHHPTTLSGYIFTTKALNRQSEKLLKQQYLHMPSEYGELRLTSGWDRFVSLGAPLQISTGFVSWQRYCTALQYWSSAKHRGVEQRAPPIFGRAAITLGSDPHF